MKQLQAFSLSLVTLSLVACGGGGGGDSSASDTPQQETGTPVVTTPSTPSNAISQRLNQYASEGYSCDSGNICERFDVIDSDYNGTYSKCDANVGSCSSDSILNYTYSALQASTINDYAQFDERYVGAVRKECKLIEANLAGCSFALNDGSDQIVIAEMSFAGNQANFNYTMTNPVSDLDLRVKSNALRSQYNLLDYKAALPVKPSAWVGQYPELSVLMDNSFADDWGGSSGFNFLYDTNFSNMRSPICTADGDFGYSCSFIQQAGVLQQCDFVQGTDYENCSVLNEQTPHLASLIDSQLALMGFDEAVKKNIYFSSRFPVTVNDVGCEPTHTSVRGRVQNAYYSGSSLTKLDLSSQQDLSLIRFSGTDDWSNVGMEAHCSGVSSVVAQNEGAYVNLVGEPETGMHRISDEGFELINNSWVLPGTTATTQHNSYNAFNVWAGGNTEENWSDESVGNSQHQTVWNSGLSSQFVVVGAVDDKLESYETSAVPGNNPTIQSRWLVALGVDVAAADSIGGTEDSISLHTGTSFATPFVSRALALGKSYCPTSSYSSISNVLLETADKSFSAYDPAKHGQGFLDVSSFISRLGEFCP